MESGNWENENLSQILYKVYRGHSSGATCCSFCFDDKKIISGSEDGSIKLWIASTGKIEKRFDGHRHSVSYCRLSNDNRRLVSSSWDKMVRAWDVETGKIIWSKKQEGLVTSCDISHDGKMVLSASDHQNGLSIMNAEDGTIMHYLKDFHKSTPTCCEFSPNSDRIVSTGIDRVVKIWDIKSTKTTATLEGHLNIVSSARFSQNERCLATTSWDKTIRVWDISTGMYRSKGSQILTKGHEGSVSCCKFSADSQLLVSGGYDTFIVIWDLETYTKKLILKGHHNWVTGVDVSKDRTMLLSSSKDKSLRLWNIEAMEKIPVVLENKRSIGLKLSKCENCGKTFSIAQIDDPDHIRTCVFCRIAGPERNTLPSIL